jgi:hypothetical protein
MKTAFRILIGGVKRAFTANGGGYLTVTAPVTNKIDLEAYIAILLRGLVLIALSYVAMKLGVPAPDVGI